MNDVTSITTSNPTPQGLGVQISEGQQLQTDFLKLLTTQLANQDPFSPMDNTAMVEQLATFSQLEQLEGVNAKLTQSMQYSESLNNTMMMNLVGKRVTVLGDGIRIDSGEPSRTLVRTIEPGVAMAKIYDENGRLVRTIDELVLKPGFTEIEWDGKNDLGDPLDDGDYRMEITAERQEGGFLSVAVFQSGIVETIQFDNNFQTLIVNGQGYSPADVVEVGIALAPNRDRGEDDAPTDEGDDITADPPGDGNPNGGDRGSVDREDGITGG